MDLELYNYFCKGKGKKRNEFAAWQVHGMTWGMALFVECYKYIFGTTFF